jgi:hypothetical protein
VKHKLAAAAGARACGGGLNVGNERARTRKPFSKIARQVTRFQPRNVPSLSKADAGDSRRSLKGQVPWGEVTSGQRIRTLTICPQFYLKIQIVVKYYALLVASMLLTLELDDSGIMHAKAQGRAVLPRNKPRRNRRDQR